MSGFVKHLASSVQGAAVAGGRSMPFTSLTGGRGGGRGLRSFPIQLNLSPSVHRITRLSS